MSSRRTVLPWLLAIGLMLPVAQARGEADAGLLSGIVRSEEASPIDSAHVYTYSLADFKLRKSLTDVAGQFRFVSLPAGLYHIVAYKSGFLPAIVALTRPAADRTQVLDLHLVREDVGDTRAAEDYWGLRSRIPPDVLREIETLRVLEAALPGSRLELPAARFSTGVEASAGVDDIVSLGDSHLAGGRVDFRSQLERMDIVVQGDFWRLEPLSGTAAAGGAWGSTNQVSLDLKSEHDARFNLNAASNRLTTRHDGRDMPVDFDHLSLSYSQPLGEDGQSAFAAQVIDESNFYRRGLVDPASIPQASTTWEVEGTYALEIGERSLIETGLRYRERQSQQVAGTGGLLDQPVERVDLFGRGGYRMQPAMLIEYGVYSVLRDGALALAPQGGLVLQVNPEWQFAARASGRVEGETDPFLFADFLPVLHQGPGAACDRGEKSCYQLQLSRSTGDQGEDGFSVGAVHREFGETLRLYFSSDFFDQQESIYLVPGDRLPELQVALTRRLSPNILTRLAGSLASGGGGTYYATDRDAYQNDVRYLITSIDTRFQSTSTGVFLAFHQLEQQLTPLERGGSPVLPHLSERLQLRVSQDLNVLLDLPADWALHLNMELSRGTQAESQEDDLRRRILGGFAVKF
jgi:hypothetical protein